MRTWIDFKALRAQLDFEQVLRHYGVEVKRKGQQHHGYTLESTTDIATTNAWSIVTGLPVVSRTAE